ncbi:hypothetical protein FOZ63_002329 [Perkinsus olseni]|uniref:Uncharacterized protein n=1 Tax=Perkinsus olseni TaxID=32597 RepID=A0A7J6QU93_PEROL|nr:hypothetical protein FOZ63_002329 [Perkinsus olseni]
MGAEFPETKQDWLTNKEQQGSTPNRVYRHLGCNWSRDEEGNLRIECIVPSRSSIIIPNPMSRTDAFRLGGYLYDPLRLHPSARLSADVLRRWFGKSEGGNKRKAWQKKWPLTDSTWSMVSKLMDNAYLDGYGSCQHNQIGSPRFIVAFCDASNEGWGLLLYAVEEEYDPSSDVFPPKEKLIEAHAGEWDDKKVNYHVNRKEAITLHRTMKAITEWLPRFMLDVRQRLQVSIYCDNSSAVAWANKGSVSMRSYDKVALQRLSESMSDMRRDCQLQFSVTLNVKYIQGLKNTIADRLSRSDIRSHMLPPLKSNTRKTPTPKEPDETVVMIATPSGELGLVDTVGLPHRGVWSSHMMDPMYVPMRTDNDLDEPLDVLVASPLEGAAATSDYESLIKPFSKKKK